MSSFKFPGADERERNRQMREKSSLDNNDMMSVKSMLAFFTNLFKDVKATIDEQLLNANERKLIKLVKEKLEISKEVAINFIKHDEEFKNLNEKTYNFNEKEIEQICNMIQKIEKVEDLNVSNILEIKNEDKQHLENTALEEIREEMSDTQAQENKSEDKQISTNKIQRNTNRK